MKEITIRYNTLNEYRSSWRGEQHLQVLIDGKPIENLKSFSINFDTSEIEPTFTIEQFMDYPINDEAYDESCILSKERMVTNK